MEYIKRIFRSATMRGFEDLKEMLNNIKLLIDNNLIDYSLIRELCIYLNVNNNKEMLQNLIENMNQLLKDAIDCYEQEINFKTYTVLHNYSIFFMLLLINLRENKQFIELIFEYNSKITRSLIHILKISKNYKKNKILNIYCNIFFDEYKEIFILNKVDELFILNNEKFTKINVEGLDIYPKEIYKIILDIVIKLDFTYEEYMTESYFNFEEEDRSLLKINFITSLIRVVLSKEKYVFINEDNYELNFLNNVIDKGLKLTRKKYGDNYNTLFRKDEIYDDIIKYIFFIFGNSLLIKAFVNPLRKYIGMFEEEIIKSDFLEFFDTMLKEIDSFMPGIIRVLIKLVFDKVHEVFTIDRNNYSPIYTMLIFNFFISPRIQDIYNIQKHTCIKSINRLLRNICYNTKFDENDELSIFNDIITKCNRDLYKTMEKILLSVENSEHILSDYCEKYFHHPKFLFYIDCSYLTTIFNVKKEYNLQSVIKELSLHIK